jgi:hypothetical protein
MLNSSSPSISLVLQVLPKLWQTACTAAVPWPGGQPEQGDERTTLAAIASRQQEQQQPGHSEQQHLGHTVAVGLAEVGSSRLKAVAYGAVIRQTNHTQPVSARGFAATAP